MTPRMPAHLEVGAMLRLAQAHGGNAMVLAKGERDAGTILMVIQRRGEDAELFERMPGLDGSRVFVRTRVQEPENRQDFTDYLDRRRKQDPDLWIVEIDVDNPEAFRAELPV